MMAVTKSTILPSTTWKESAAAMRLLISWRKSIGVRPSRKPAMVGVDVGPHQTIQVPWGRFSLPNIHGYIETGSAKVKGRQVFSINALVLRKHEREIRAIGAFATAAPSLALTAAIRAVMG